MALRIRAVWETSPHLICLDKRFGGFNFHLTATYSPIHPNISAANSSRRLGKAGRARLTINRDRSLLASSPNNSDNHQRAPRVQYPLAVQKRSRREELSPNGRSRVAGCGVSLRPRRRKRSSRASAPKTGGRRT